MHTEQTEQYDSLNDEQITALAREALGRYPKALQGDIRLLCRSENSTFLVQTDTARYAMRVHRPNYHEKCEIESELDWLDALRADTGLEVPTAVADKNGERVQTMRLPGGEERYAVMFNWVEGDILTNSVDPKAFRALGEITAKLHMHSRAWLRPSGFKRIIWNHETMVSPQSHWGDWRDAAGITPADHPLIEEVVHEVGAIMKKYGQSPQKYGLIHADLRLTNLVEYKGETRVIDFDDCGMGWFVHDLAAAISFEEHHPNAPEWVENWLDGYERIAHFDDDDLAVLPAMIIQRRIQMTAWVGTHASTDMAKSLQSDWTRETVRLCRLYQKRSGLPLGVEEACLI